MPAYFDPCGFMQLLVSDRQMMGRRNPKHDTSSLCTSANAIRFESLLFPGTKIKNTTPHVCLQVLLDANGYIFQVHRASCRAVSVQNEKTSLRKQNNQNFELTVVICTQGDIFVSVAWAVQVTAVRPKLLERRFT